MRRIERDKQGKEYTVIVKWDEHVAGCSKCQSVQFSSSASFVNACAEGSPLLMEELVKRQRPVQRKKDAEILEWAKKTGVFKV